MKVVTPIIWFDMDGVICKYERNAYLPKPHTDTPAFITKDEHYFATCKPDNTIINALLLLTHAKIPFGILSSVWQFNNDIRNEQIEDKAIWLNQYLPITDGVFVPDFPAVFSGYDKSEAIKAAGLWCSNSAENILIDDYPKNLAQWQRAGGTAIKYINGLNSPWNGPMIHHTQTHREICEYIYDIYRSFTSE